MKLKITVARGVERGVVSFNPNVSYLQLVKIDLILF